MNLTAVDTDDRSRLFWRLQAVGWGGALLVTFGIGGQVYSPASEGILVGILRNIFGFAVTSVILRPLLGFIRSRGKVCTVPHLAGILVACGLLGLFDTIFTTYLADALHLDLDQPGVRPFLAASILIRSVLYVFWSILYFAVQYRLDTQRDQLRMARAEAAARSSELQVLRAQVNPHFLFNALNSILAASGDATVVRRTTLALADYLRFSLAQRGETERLGIELEALENYLKVEKARFEDNFEYLIETDGIAPRIHAPIALVQPLLENAIKYGQLSPVRPLRITVSAAVENGTLAVTVTNSGDWIEADSATKTGLANLRRRLDLLYPEKASLVVEAGDGRVRAQVCVPAQHSGEQP